MDIKPLRTHPKMTKNLLDQIDTLQRSNHTSDEIASTLGITPEAVERGFDKLSERRRAEIHATTGSGTIMYTCNGSNYHDITLTFWS